MTAPSPKPPKPKPFRNPVPHLLDLHDPELDATGRVDVLVARGLRRAMSIVPDPVLKALYEQFQPVIDSAIHAKLKQYNCASKLRELGFAPPKPRPLTRAQKDKRRRKRA